MNDETNSIPIDDALDAAVKIYAAALLACVVGTSGSPITADTDLDQRKLVGSLGLVYADACMRSGVPPEKLGIQMAACVQAMGSRRRGQQDFLSDEMCDRAHTLLEGQVIP